MTGVNDQAGLQEIRIEVSGVQQRKPVSSSSMVEAASLKEEGVARAKGLVKAPAFSS